MHFSRKKNPSTDEAGIVTDSTPVVGSYVGLLSYYYHSASIPEAVNLARISTSTLTVLSGYVSLVINE